MSASTKHSKAAPAASVNESASAAHARAALSSQVVPARVFNLAGTSIKRWETGSLDVYRGPLDELLSLGIVREDQLPPEGKRSISWRGREHPGRGRSKIDETAVCVWIHRNDVTIGLGVSKATQQERKRASDSKASQYLASLEHKRQAAASKELADVPKSKDAFRRDVAKTARVMMLVAAKHASQVSDFHGFQIDSESMEEIHARIDDVIEAFLNAQVQFDAKRQAEVIAAHQHKILDASPSARACVKALMKVDPSILQGESA